MRLCGQETSWVNNIAKRFSQTDPAHTFMFFQFLAVVVDLLLRKMHKTHAMVVDL